MCNFVGGIGFWFCACALAGNIYSVRRESFGLYTLPSLQQLRPRDVWWLHNVDRSGRRTNIIISFFFFVIFIDRLRTPAMPPR